MNNLKLDNKQIDSAIAQAFLSYFYARKLISAEEFLRIKNKLSKEKITVDIITLKSDICNKED